MFLNLKRCWFSSPSIHQGMGPVVIRNLISPMDMECLELIFRNPSDGYGEWTRSLNVKEALFSGSRNQMRRHRRCRVLFALDSSGGSLGTGGGRGSLDGSNAGFGRTRLGEIASVAARELLEKLNSARRDFPMKIFLVLLGFYTANALATILGQTGDWDVVVAGVVVASIEAIGMLMYRTPSRIPSSSRLRALMVFVNYWKAGVCLGLFVDAFKLGS